MSALIRSAFHELCSLPQCLWHTSGEEAVVINLLSGLAVVHTEAEDISTVHLASCCGRESQPSSVQKIREIDAQHLQKLLAVWRAQAIAAELADNTQ